ncbi:unnamed protein product [Blepharisma stoltei]|uniref:Uncharacterized protein n=1 Tax=Blepharisma stoltei TaxID=1481888 RepID=A0AAU9I7U6_9CILI|nr:unnamed protein product [Blepharisma stoltei]
MANIPYYIVPPCIPIRKKIVDAQTELYRSQKKLLYEEPPIMISYYKSFISRKSIEFFFENVLRPMELFTDIETYKKKEAFYNLYHIKTYMHMVIKALICGVGAYFSIKVDPEWLWKYKLIYIPYFPIKDLVKRFAIIAVTGFFYKQSYRLVPWVICLWYPNILADLQIGSDFELGYWTQKFVKGI